MNISLQNKNFIRVASIVLFLFIVNFTRAQTLDQSCSSNGDAWNLNSGCNSGGWAGQLGQSFTAGTSGNLHSIELKTGSSNSASANYDFYVYSGNGVGGTLLYSVTGGALSTPSAASTNFTITLSSAVAITSGQQYTFLLIYNSGSQTTIATNNSNSCYAGGTAYECSNGHSVQSASYLDLDFKTYITAGGGGSSNALQFNGVNYPSGTYIAVPHSSQFNFGTSTDFTFEFWLKPDANANTFTSIITKAQNAGTILGYQVFYANKKISIEFGNGSTNGFVQSTSDLTSSGTWHHVAIVVKRSANTADIIIDGTTEATLTNSLIGTSMDNTSRPLEIGRTRGGSDPTYNGLIDDIRIWSNARTVSEINSNKNCEVSASSSNLVAYYKLNETSGTTASDATSNGLNGTLYNFSGTPWVSGTVTSGCVAASSDATLSAMTLSSGTLSPSFASGTTTYTASVTSSTSSITVTPTRNEAHATIQVRVNGGSYASVTSGTASFALNLNFGANTINVKVTAEDGSTIVTYTTTVTRANYTAVSNGNWTSTSTWDGNEVPSSGSDIIVDADLDINTNVTVHNLTINSGRTLNHTSNTLSIQSGGTLACNGTGYFHSTYLVEFLGSASKTGAGTATFTYIYADAGNVDFGSSSNIDGGYLRISQGASISNKPSYTNPIGLIYTGAGSITIGQEWPTGNANIAGVSIDAGTTLSFGSITSSRTAGTGNNDVFTIDGTLSLSSASGGDLILQHTYANFNGTFNANGRKVTISGGGNHHFQPNSNTNPITFYDLEISGVPQCGFQFPVTITHDLKLTSGVMYIGNYDLTINSGATITGGSASSYLFHNGSGKLVRKNIGNSATLFPLGISWSSYTPLTITNGGNFDYAVKVLNTAPSGTGVVLPSKVLNREWDITPSGAATNVDLSFQYNTGDGKTGGTFSETGSMRGIHYNTGNSSWESIGTATATGSNPYSVAVTCPSFHSSLFSVSNFYSSDATLSNMTLSSGTLSPSFASGTTSYTASLSNATSSITVTPTHTNANATIEARVNGGSYSSVTSGSASSALSLNVGINTVDVRVTAQDGVTQIVYSTSICRAPSVVITNPLAVCSPSTVDLTAPAVTAGSTGSLTYTYWTDNAATSSYATPSTASTNTYYIKGTDANGCYAISSVSATVNPLATITNTSKAAYNGLDLTCNGTSTGQITVTASGGTSTLQYSKDNGTNFQLSNVFSGLSANTYLIKVKDVNTCTTTATSVTINAPVVVSFSTSKTAYNGVDLSCHNGTDGQITVTPAGGSGTYSYSKNNGGTWQVSNVFSGLGAGTYLIKVKDANNCTPSAQSVTINNPAALSLAPATNNGPICEDFTLSLTSSATGGTGAYSYAWSGPLSYTSSSQNPTVSLLSTAAMSGSYKIIITDVNGCKDSVTTTATVNEMPHFTSNASPVTNTICEGSSTTITCTNAGSGVGSPSYTGLYSNNFNTAIGSGWSFPATVPVTSTPTLKSWNGASVLGNMGAQKAILSLTGIPSHDFITVDYDLYIHDSWDGNNTSSGPDVFNMLVDGDTSVHTTFSNWSFTPYNLQAYPNNIPASNPYFSGAVTTNLPTACNSAVSTLSTKYHITKTIAHSASSLTLLLEAVGIEVACNESWSIDNLVIQRRTPAPSSNIVWSTSQVASAITVSPTDTTVYTASNGTCSNAITINVNPTPRANFDIDNAGQCILTNNFNLTNTSTLAGPGGFTSAWTMTGSNASTISPTEPKNVSNLTYPVFGTKDVTLQVTSVYGNCSSSSLSLASKTKQLDITDTVFVRASNNNPICLGSSVTLNATQNGVLSGSGPAVYSSYYTNNFNSTSDTASWTFPATVPATSTPVVKTWNGRTVLGNMGAQQAILNLSGLPAHDKIKVEFDLYIHDSWDGNNVESGPDNWNMKVDGSSVINTTFSNWWFTPYNTQAYPGNVPASNPNFTGAVETNLPTACNSVVSTLSTRYRISKVIDHSASSLALLLEAVGIEVACNESWSIDSLSIQMGATSGVVTNAGAVQWSDGSSSTNSTIVVSPGLGNTTYTATIGHCTTSYTVSVAPVPTPAFSYSNVNCSKTLSFSNTNVEASVSYAWNFGDGSAVYNGNTAPNHTYTNGTYTITLTATLPSGCTRQTTRTVSIADQPTAAFSYTTSNSCTNGVFFTNTSSVASGNTASYSWNFGDATTSTDVNPTKTYAAASSYNVILTVTTGTTCTDSYSHSVSAPAGIAAATANFTAAVTTACGNKVTTTNLTTGTGNRYYWNFDDGSTSNDFEPTHYYLTGGNRTISLMVTNVQGCTSTFNQQVSISNNSGSTGRISVDFSILPNDTQVLSTNKFEFIPAFTNMPNNNPPVYANGSPSWTFGDASTSSSTHVYNKTYAAVGNYTVRVVQLTTNTGCYAEASKVVTVLPTPVYVLQNNGKDDVIKDALSTASATSGLNNINDNLAQINLFPNPNNGSFKVLLNHANTKNAQVSIVDMIGREVYNNSFKLNGTADELEINDLNVNAGSYNMIITSDGAILARKAFVVAN